MTSATDTITQQRRCISMRSKKPTDFSDVYSTFDYVGANCYSIMY